MIIFNKPIHSYVVLFIIAANECLSYDANTVHYLRNLVNWLVSIITWVN